MTQAWPVMQTLIEQAPRRRRWPPRMRRSALPPGLYIFAYHSLYDEATAEPWERHYDRVLTKLKDFRAHLAFLCDCMESTTLASAESLFAGGTPDAPSFAVTFDDGYVSVGRVAADLCGDLGIEPTVFACSDFASGRAVYYRVLLAQLEAEGRGGRVAELLSQTISGAAFGGDLMSETKERYAPGTTEAAINAAWREAHGHELPHAHLGYDDLRKLVAEGWTVANHTRSHATLSALPAERLDDEILGCQSELEAEHLQPLPWLAYPNGAARHVGPDVGAWLDRHSELMGAHGNGGVNLQASLTEWLRIPVGDEDVAQLGRRIESSLEATRWALAQRATER